MRPASEVVAAILSHDGSGDEVEDLWLDKGRVVSDHDEQHGDAGAVERLQVGRHVRLERTGAGVGDEEGDFAVYLGGEWLDDLEASVRG